MGVLDSSFLVMPLGNDLLVIALTAQKHSHMPFYALMATAGSVLGCFIIDLVFRKGGEETLGKHVPKKRLDYIKCKMEKRAGWALVVAALMPPPFPFTPFVAAAAAFEYPRHKLLSIIGAARLVRFAIDGALAIAFGKRILSLAESPVVQWVVILLIVLAIGGSAFSIYRWIQRSRQPKVRKAGGR